MPRTQKVLSSTRFRTASTASVLNLDTTDRSVVIGRRSGSTSSATGYLGKVCEQSRGASLLDYSVWLDLQYPHVIGIFGSRGSGKSFDLGVICECLAGLDSVSDGTAPSNAVILFDIQNQFWTLGMSPDADLPEDRDHLESLDTWGLPPDALPNIRLWLPVGLPTQLDSVNSFRLSPEQLTEDDWLSLLELDRYSPMGQIVIELVSQHPDNDPAGLQSHAVPGGSLSAFQDSSVDGVRWRLGSLSNSQLVGSPGINIDDLLTRGEMSVLLLRDMPEGLRSLVVGVVTRLVSSRLSSFHQQRRVMRRTRSQVDEADLPDRVWLVLDEAHVVVPATGTTAASAPIVDYVKRGRDSGLSLIFATQQPSAVDSQLMSQVDLTITHPLGFDSDLTAAVHRMPTRTNVEYQTSGSTIPALTDVIRALEPGEAVVADAASGRVFLTKIRPRLTAHGGNVPN